MPIDPPAFRGDGLETLARLAVSGAGAPDGLPDAATLSRFATGLYRALPGTGETPAAAVSSPSLEVPPQAFPADSVPLAPPVEAPSVGAADESLAIPGEGELRTLLAAVLPQASQSRTDKGFGAGGLPYFYTPAAAAPSGGADVPALATALRAPFDVEALRRDFPILSARVHGRPLVWLDNAATTQKPQVVIDRLAHFYARENSNIHRAAHTLAARATDAYEKARETVRRFLNAPSVNEIVFVRGTTEGINLVAQSWGRQNIGKGDEILLTHLEHHANIVPWQLLAAEREARLVVAPVDERGALKIEEFHRLLSPRTRLVAFSHVSNALGTVTPAKEMIEAAHRAGALVLLDGAQSVAHMPIDLQDLNPDFFVFSGHKIFGPTGIGALWGREALLNAMPPWQGGGNMIAGVTFERTLYQAAPARFEAGTGNIADAAGLAAALEYLERIGMHAIARYEHELLVYGTKVLSEISGLRLIGTAPAKAGVLSFKLDGFPDEEVGAALDREGIAVRAGHHCAQPILRRFGLESTVRPSLAFYNTFAELDLLAAVLRRLAGRRGG